MGEKSPCRHCLPRRVNTPGLFFMPKLLWMNGNSPRSGRWMQRARGIFLVCLLTLGACSTDPHREIPQASQADSRATTETAKSIPPAPSVANSPNAQESRDPVAATHPEEKSVSNDRSIFFPDGDAELSEDSLSLIRQHAEYLKLNPKRFITLRAYLDSLGSRTYSLAIVQKRLDAVARALHEQGVARSRIRQVMLGQRGKRQPCERPLCTNRGQRIELLDK
jgi:peptidoglycan-associated lipoprotein